MNDNRIIFCPLCGSGDTEPLHPSTVPSARRATISPDEFLCTGIRYGEHDDILRCDSCGFVFSDSPFTPEQLLDAYSQVVDERYTSERPARMATFRRSMDIIGRHAERGRVLDVGCYTGFFLEVCRNRGWETAGVEPSHWAVERARSRGLDIFRGSLHEADFPENHFDLITIWDVLEHFPRPREAVRLVNRLLKPGGRLFLTTFDLSSRPARLLGPRYPMFARAHVSYFSTGTLRELLESEGFTEINHRPHRRLVSAAYLAEHAGIFAPPLKGFFTAPVRALKADNLILPLLPMGIVTTWGEKAEQAE